MTRALTFSPVYIVPLMAFLPQELLLLIISKDMSCKQDILGGAVEGNRDLKHLQLSEQLILQPHLSIS
jgi:hypothetical protein